VATSKNTVLEELEVGSNNFTTKAYYFLSNVGWAAAKPNSKSRYYQDIRINDSKLKINLSTNQSPENLLGLSA
jgi:HKD family nuclease